MVQRSVTFPRILFLAGFNGLFMCVVLVFSKSFTISDEEDIDAEKLQKLKTNVQYDLMRAIQNHCDMENGHIREYITHFFNDLTHQMTQKGLIMGYKAFPCPYCNKYFDRR